ncbi:hypothetical protein [Paractinoplanes atraurantiacus]|uniref:hypothetical protein n=1 Tax=Paractinoplanes atraurantiacus TaxID=1036182 RepID=UPI0011776BE0|nr:hypothetical protein [Actinoplanes atraurantiacus]
MRNVQASRLLSLLRSPLLALMYGPVAVMVDLLVPIGGVDAAYISGSWAARHAGQPGPPPRDVDDLAAAARTAEGRLGREVNDHRVFPANWRSANDDPFLTSVRSRPLQPLLKERGRSCPSI